MSNPAAPKISGECQRPHQAGQPGIVSDPDGPNLFGPDTPNIGPDDPSTQSATTPEALPPSPRSLPLDNDSFAPDEA
jgi:hypothetical protein